MGHHLGLRTARHPGADFLVNRQFALTVLPPVLTNGNFWSLLEPTLDFSTQGVAVLSTQLSETEKGALCRAFPPALPTPLPTPTDAAPWPPRRKSPSTSGCRSRRSTSGSTGASPRTCTRSAATCATAGPRWTPGSTPRPRTTSPSETTPQGKRSGSRRATAGSRAVPALIAPCQ